MADKKKIDYLLTLLCACTCTYQVSIVSSQNSQCMLSKIVSIKIHIVYILAKLTKMKKSLV